jgi:hypothetical protein
VAGLDAGLERKNGWTLAERASEVSPDGMQRLLRLADWDVDGVRDDVRDYVVERVGDTDGVLIVDDTGFLKKGTHSAGVQRQYSGTAGRVGNCQIGVFLAYASAAGHALIDRELYLPESWTVDRERCRAAGIGDVELATKPVLAQHMIQRALDAKVPFSWFTADEAYGQVKYLRMWLEERDASYVLATRLGAGPRTLAARPPIPVGSDRDRVLHLRRTPSYHAHRTRRRRRIAVAGRGVLPAGRERGRPGPVPGVHLPGLLRPHHLVDARPRLASRDENRSSKGGIGIDDHGMIGYTVPEIRRLQVQLILRHARPDEHVWSWSRWRIRRQHQARSCHYRTRGHVL